MLRARNSKYKFTVKAVLLLGMLLCIAELLQAQITRPRRPTDIGNINLPGNRGQNASDTLGFQHRDDLADSITISYRYLDSLNKNSLDSSLNDFGKYYTVPTGYLNLGNNGSAAFPILYTPLFHTGFDPGFHAFDIYRYTIKNTKFYQTTRPYTELHYYLATGKEQVIKVFHTQNINPGWNASLEYRLISSPGNFDNQNTSHNSYRFASRYQGRRKRYAAHLVVLANKLNAAENGGIEDPQDLFDPAMRRRVAVPVNLGEDVESSFAVFSKKIAVGNEYSDLGIFFRQSYDVGKKDSIIINDSTTEYLFYPKLRFQHTVHYTNDNYRFVDYLESFNTAKDDAQFFANHYDISINPYGSQFSLQDEWRMIRNDFVIRQFPQNKSLTQYIEAGIRLENFSGTFTGSSNDTLLLLVNPEPSITKAFYNVALHGEYRNKTRNRKWDAILRGVFYPTGYNAGDYKAFASVSRNLNPKWGDITISFQNLSRTPSYEFKEFSAFDLDSSELSKKENITVLSFHANNPKFNLMARNISITNYPYLTDYYHTAQYDGIINLTQASLSTKNKIVGHLNLYSDFIFQLTTGSNPVKVPLISTRQRLAFEGTFFKNLNLSTGLDVQYHTPYKANNYSPVMGRFFPQDSITISNLPQINVFFNFRIKSLTLFLKAENLNTLYYSEGLGFINNNFTAPRYPTPGFIFRFALKWNFVN